MFYVMHTDGAPEPRLRCHVCACQIDQLAQAVMVYPRTGDEGQTSRAVAVHRGACVAKARQMLENDQGAPCEIPFDAFLSQLRSTCEAEYSL